MPQKKTVSQSLAFALQEEKANNDEISVRGAFGWHNRADINAKSGRSNMYNISTAYVDLFTDSFVFTALGVARNYITACLSKSAEYRTHSIVHSQSGG
jgi:hypothetical protein